MTLNQNAQILMMLPTLISVETVHEREWWKRKDAGTDEEGDGMAEVGGGGKKCNKRKKNAT